MELTFFSILGGALAILGAFVSRQLHDEFKAWTPRLIDNIIQRAVHRLPENERNRYDEEWRSHIDEIPGEVWKLKIAFGFLQASWKISWGLTDDTSYLVGKRAFDITFSSVLLIVFLPVFALIVFVLKRGSGDHVISRTVVVGQEAKRKALLNFSVVTEGNFLRRMKLESLPQLINVIRGDLSLVGPRALSSSEIRMINDKQISKLFRRMEVKPGLFGWAKMNGYGEGTTTPEKLRREIEHDIYYIDNRSFLLDLKILMIGLWNHVA